MMWLPNIRVFGSQGWCEDWSESEVPQSCPTLCDPMDCSLPDSSIDGIFQARMLEWVAISWGLSTHKVFAYICDTCQSLLYHHNCWCYYFIFVHFNCFCIIVVHYSFFCPCNRGGTGWVNDSIMQMKQIQRWAEISPSPSEPRLAQGLFDIHSQAISHNPAILPPLLAGQPSFLSQWFLWILLPVLLQALSLCRSQD